MNNIFNSNKPVKHVGRNGFDLSSAHTFVMRPGVLRPVIFQHCVPDASYKINCADIVRTGSLQTAAFLRGKQDLDFFFVPYSQIYSESNHVIFGRGDYHSPLSLSLNEDAFPVISLPFLVGAASVPYIVMRLCNHVDSSSALYSDVYGVTRLILENFGWTSAYLTTNRVAWQRDLFYNPPSVDVINIGISYVNFVGADCLQLLSTLGYGDYYAYFNDIVNRHLPDTPFASDTEIQLCAQEIYADCASFLFYLNGQKYDIDSWEPLAIGRRVNLLNLCAYQKVWMDVFRDTINDSDTSAYVYGTSCDRNMLTLSIFVNEEKNDVLATYLRPRLRMFFKDLSCGIYENSQFGTQIDSTAIVPNADSFNFTPEQVGNTTNVTATNMRFILAMQRYRETLLRAGSRAKDLLMSEFGVKSRYIDDVYVHHVGSFDAPLELNKVSATAETGSYSVGDLAGNVFSSLQGSTIDFTSNDHGILLGVMSFYPIPMHNAFGISPFILKSRQFDFYHSDFENLGLQPVSSHLFSPFRDNGQGQYVSAPSTLGFSARYFEYKQNLDLVHDSFTSEAVFPTATDSGYPLPRYDGQLGADSNFVCVKPTKQDISLLRARSYMLPSIMDTIFSERDNGDPLNAHFKATLQCSINGILPMSVLGL